MNPAQFAFVLARPKIAGNIGSVARALKNMGFDDLRLAAPASSHKSKAARDMAVHAADLLENARIFDNLREAVSDRMLTVGTTCRAGQYRCSVKPLRESAGELVGLAESNRIAIIFGPEDTGLTNSEIKLCERLIAIPASPDYPSLNLAQAVMLVAYELRMAADESTDLSAPLQFANAAEVDAMLERLKHSLVAIGFAPQDNPEHIMFAMRQIFGRSGLLPRELDILNGIAAQIRWVAEGGNRVLDEKRRAGKPLR